MIQYALIDLNTSSMLKTQYLAETPLDISHKGLKWLPYTLIRPPLDATQYKELAPQVVITETEVIETYTQQELTQQEKDNLRLAEIEEGLFSKDIHLGNAIFYLYNRLREHENLPAATKEDFLTFVDSLTQNP